MIDTQAPVSGLSDYQFGFSDPEISVFKPEKGLNEKIIRTISAHKNEPEWMLEYRLRALRAFRRKPMPNWGAEIGDFDFDDVYYYIKPIDEGVANWEDLPEDILNTYDKLGLPEAERKFLAGMGAQYDSEVVYHSIKAGLEEQGVIFLPPEEAVARHPDLVRKYFGKVVPYNDNKFSALNSAAWSGGTFLYIPPNVKVEIPLQSYFRINSENLGQFERTLIIADKNSFVHYIEGCTAPIYTTDLLHSAVVEIIAEEGARVRYTTIQNWSGNVYNLVTQRALVKKNAAVEWVDGNIGSKRTMKYPAVYLTGEGAHGEILSIAFGGRGQEQDTGGKAVHKASNTSSVITSKSISKDGGIASYRGLVKVAEGLKNVKSHVICDALLLDETSITRTFPYMEIESEDVSMEHEALVSRISEDQLFYLMARGLSEEEASMMIVNGFLEPLVKQLPMEYAVELNRLIELEMEGSVG